MDRHAEHMNSLGVGEPVAVAAGDEMSPWGRRRYSRFLRTERASLFENGERRSV